VGACPGRRYVFVPDVMAHRRGARGKEREIAAALSLQLELIGLDGLADLVVGNPCRRRRRQGGILEARGLGLAKPLMRRGRGRIVAVTVDDHAVYRFQAVSGCSVPLKASTASNSSASAAGVCGGRRLAAHSCLAAQARLIRGSRPASATACAASRISSARRRPCWREREII